jgi:hypothetical protein
LRAKLKTPVHLLAKGKTVGGAQRLGEIAAPQFGVNGNPGFLSGQHFMALPVKSRRAQSLGVDQR